MRCRPHLLAGLLTALLLAAAAPVRAQGVGQTTSRGSQAPDIYLDDITYTLRGAYFRTATVSPHDPNVAYVTSFDGYLWKTVDGGRTWVESRLIVETRPFFGDIGERLYFGVHRGDGALRAMRIPSPIMPGQLGTTASAARGEGFGLRVPAQLESSMFGAFAAMPNPSGGGGNNVNFGIGLPGGAPRLQLLVRKLGKPTSGVNMKQTLVMRGTRPTEVRIVVIHPSDPNIVFACSAFGLYRSTDAGSNWVRVFSGISPRDRFALHVAVDPKDPRRVLLASGDGMWLSTDSGESFYKATQGGVGAGMIFWITFNPYDPRYIFAGTDSGLLRSADDGATWDYIYFTSFPTARVVVNVEIDPHDRKTGYITTADGVFTTPDILHGGLESWSRLGGLLFSGVISERIRVCPRHKGHLWLHTNVRTASVNAGMTDAGGSFIMESLDAGRTWRVIDAGNTSGSMQWFENDPRDPDLLWIVWSRSLARMRRRVGAERAQAPVVIPDDPPMGEVLMAAQVYTGTDPKIELGYRSRSRWKALLPRVTASYSAWRTNDYSLIREGLFPNLPFRFDGHPYAARNEFRIFASWNLGDLVFNLDSSMFGRVSRLSYEVKSQMQMPLHRLYGELRRLRVLMRNDPPKDLRVRLLYRVRMEELTSYVNFITGNYLTHWWQGHRDSGIDGKWWEPWTRAPGEVRTNTEE